MAQKKRKHGKVEARKARPLLRFKPGVLLIIILLTFAFCFLMYMVSAVKQKDYWEKEIIASMQAENGNNGNKKKPVKVTNPVPSSERADESRMSSCAFIGDVSEFTNYYKTTSGLVFTDAVTGMSESRMRSIGRSLRGVSPTAVYVWYQCPSDLEKGAAAYGELVNTLRDQMASVPIYVLTATPATDTAENQRIDTWNAALFAMADEKGLHYVDVSTTLKANDGLLAPVYDEDEILYRTVGDLILTHVAD